MDIDEAPAMDERSWAADKRDFVADRRDEIADERDAAADARDELADEREAELVARERRLNARAAGIGRPPGSTAPPGQAARRGHREERAREREAAAAAREQATKQRDAATPTTGLAMAFAELASYLYAADGLDEVLDRIVESAVSTIADCDMASVTVRDERGALRTSAWTDPAAVEADQAQYAAGEGPCLDALDTTVVYTPSLPDPRWPALGARPAESGVRSVVSYRLAASGRTEEGALVGSLNNYAGAVDAFDADAREVGLALAAHASVAARATTEREALEELGRGLHEALSSRDVIGQAKGILMERLRVTPDDAFDLLRHASSRLNVKLREVAGRLAETGELGAPGETASDR